MYPTRATPQTLRFRPPSVEETFDVSKEYSTLDEEENDDDEDEE